MPNFRRNLAVKVETPGGDNPLLLSLVTNGPFYRGIPVSGVALAGRGGTAPYAYAIIAGALPTGLSLNGITGAITGTPSVQGHFTFVAQVQDSAANVFNQSFSIDVRSQLFQVGPLPVDGEIGLAYHYQFVVRDASGTTLTIGYSITAGNLPAGLSMNAAGLITGTPVAPEGISYATLTVTDGTDTLTLAFTITVYTFLSMDFAESRDPPNGWGGGAGTWLPSMIRGQEWQAHLVVSGGRPPYSFSESLVNPFPSGINLVANYRQLLSGKTMDPSSPFPDLLAVGVTDSLGSFLLVQRAFFIVDSQQGRITPQRNGVDVGADGPLNWNLKEGAGVTITASNDGNTVEFEISAGPPGGSGISTINGIVPDSSGNFTVVSDGSISIVENSNGELEFSVVGGGSQAGIQFEDQGSNLGTAGTVTELDFVGTGVTATRVSNKVTVTVPGSSAVTAIESINGIGPDSDGNVSIVAGSSIDILVNSGGSIVVDHEASGITPATYGSSTQVAQVTVNTDGHVTAASNVNIATSISTLQAAAIVGGTGEDGNCTLDGVNTFPWCTLAGSVYTQTRNCCVAELKISTGITLVPAAFHFWAQKWTCTSGFYGYIDLRGALVDGSNAAGTVQGTAGTRGFVTAQYFAISTIAPTNGSPGSSGNAGSTTAVAAIGNSFGGQGSRGGKGGNGTPNTGQLGGTVGAVTGWFPVGNPFAYLYQLSDNAGRLNSGGPGTGGGGGGGDGTNVGGGGGGGGAGSGSGDFSFGEIVTDASTPAAMINAKGGNGGNGASRTVGNVGGGAGGGAGSGGYIRCLIGFHTGPAVTNFFDASGGRGGDGGTKAGTGTNGDGAPGAESGRILLVNYFTGLATFQNLATGSAISGTTGGAGGLCRLSLA